MSWISYLILFVVILSIYLIFRKGSKKRQLAYIENYNFHKSIREKICNKHPHLNDDQTQLVFQALRDYFWMCNTANKKMVAMPSQVVDDAWHEFILFTRSYNIFCRKALGRFLHHTPTEAMRTPTQAEKGIKRAWRLACTKDEIDPGNPITLPLIFAIDSMLKITNGFKYSLNCKDRNSPAYGDGYCAGHIGCSSGCTGDSGVETTESGAGGFFDSGGSDCGGGGCGGD